MATNTYTYDNTVVNVGRLEQEIAQSADITIALDSIDIEGTTVLISMKAELPDADETALNAIVAAHTPVPLVDHQPLLDADGALRMSPKPATEGRHYQLHGMTFTTAGEGSFEQLDENHSNLNYGTMAFYDHDGIQVSGTENMHKACTTVVDWEPPFDYEIAGGMFHQYGSPSGELILNVIALPDIPVAAGGNIRFVLATDLRFIGPDTGLQINGHTTSKLVYSPYHTNKLRMSLHHGSGVQHDMYIGFEIYT